MARAELVERAALDHFEIRARLAPRGPPVGPAAERHVWRIAGQIEAVDGATHHLLFPVIVEIGQQRGARSPDRRVDVAIDPRGRGRHGAGFPLLIIGRVLHCAANVPPPRSMRKQIAALTPAKSNFQPFLAHSRIGAELSGWPWNAMRPWPITTANGKLCYRGSRRGFAMS